MTQVQSHHFAFSQLQLDEIGEIWPINRTDLVCRIKKAIFSVVISLAAIHKSPSFSLLSSSITTTNSPLLNASRASSIGSKEKSEVEVEVDAMVFRFML